MKEIIGSQRLRKEGKWKEAQALLGTVREEAKHDSIYLNEMLHVRAAELCHTKPAISAADMYADLYALTESVPARLNATTFNAILLGLRSIGVSRSSNNPSGEGRELEVAAGIFDTMLDRDLVPDHFTMSILFQMCASNRSLHHTRSFHERARDTFGFEANVVSGSALLAAYAKCGKIDCVEEVFQDLQLRKVLLNERAYTSVISAYHRSGKHAKVIECFHAAMSSDSVEPNIFLFSGALASCCKAKDVVNARNIFEAMARYNVRPTEEVFETLFEIALRTGDIQLGSEILIDWAPKQAFFAPKLDYFNKLIAACKKSLTSPEKTVNCLKTIVKQLSEGTTLKPDVVTLNALISSFAKLGCFAEAQLVLERDFQKYGLHPDVVTYNTLMHSLGKVKGSKFALKVYRFMQKNGVEPNEFTYNTLFNILLEAGETDTVAMITRNMKRDTEAEESLQLSTQLKLFRTMQDPESALREFYRAVNADQRIDSFTYGLMLKLLLECDCEEQAITLFGMLVWRRVATPSIFNIVMDHCAQTRRDPLRCLEMFEAMKKKGVAPDGTTYSILIHACARIGLIDRAFRLLGEMQDVGIGLGETHAWTSLIDGCGRAGQWERATDLLKSMHDGRSRQRFIPPPTTACYNAAIYAAGMRGGSWTKALEVYNLLMADEDRHADFVTYSAMASTILQNRYDIIEWDIVREIYRGLVRFVRLGMEEQEAGAVSRPARRQRSPDGKADKPSSKKLLQKTKRLSWLLGQVVDGKKLERPMKPGDNTAGDTGAM